MPIKGVTVTFRQTLAMVAYLGPVAAFLVGSLGLIDDLKTRSQRAAEASPRLDQVSSARLGCRLG